MRIRWLGQAGLLLQKQDFIILIDPYLSDSVEKANPKMKRRAPIDEALFEIKPDVLICTHNHLDHTDPETISRFLNSKRPIQVLCPQAAWQEARKNGGDHNYILFNRHTRISYGGIAFTAVKAEHSDIHPIGVIIDDGDKKYYITGDTLFNSEIFEDILQGIDAVFLPINGTGNNMNMVDAAEFAKKVGARKVVPLHWGMFDDLDPKRFAEICENVVIPEVYKEINL